MGAIKFGSEVRWWCHREALGSDCRSLHSRDISDHASGTLVIASDLNFIFTISWSRNTSHKHSNAVRLQRPEHHD
jgi:hypothetical protein